MLESYIRDRLKAKRILLMTHIVVGYPSMEHSRRIVSEMVRAGVDLMELQIPFSEPMADGPVILHANQKALERGATVKRCMDFAVEMNARHPIPFLYMTYYNIPLQFGIEDFANSMKRAGIAGAIIPDLPPEEGREYLKAMHRNMLAPIFIYSPTTSDCRMRYLSSVGGGFLYCVARRGVTGETTSFSSALDEYLRRCREAAELPLAVGFGVKERRDVEYLAGKADIAVVGSQAIRIVERQGVEAVGEFVRALRY